MYDLYMGAMMKRRCDSILRQRRPTDYPHTYIHSYILRKDYSVSKTIVCCDVSFSFNLCDCGTAIYARRQPGVYVRACVRACVRCPCVRACMHACVRVCVRPSRSCTSGTCHTVSGSRSGGLRPICVRLYCHLTRYRCGLT